MTTDTPTTAKVFFSWQSDTASRENRSLIEWALNRAIKILKADVDVSEADRSLAIDRDTIDTPGMPPVADTIFKKIDEAAIFVSDLTYVAFRARGEGIPNPNVLLEHGWALKSKGWPQVVGLMNTAYGHPKTHPLPFDLLHSRWPILYNCPAGADDAVRNAAREELAAVLVKALKLSIADDGFGASALGPHPHDVALLDRLRKLIPDRIHNFLVTHSFGTPFPRALLDPLFALRFEWIGARHEFHDRKLQAALETVREANEAFYSLVDTHVSATENRSDWCTAKPQEIPNETSRQAMYAAIKALDGTASRLAETLDAFERVARHRIRAEPAAGQVVDTTAEATKAFEAAWRVHPPAIVSQPSLSIRYAPLSVDSRKPLTPAAIVAALPGFAPNLDDRVQEGADETQWWVNKLSVLRPGFPNPETEWLTRVIQPGVLEHIFTLGAREEDDAVILVPGRRLEGRLVRALDHIAALAEAIGLGGPALVDVVAVGVETVELTEARGGGRPIGKPSLAVARFEYSPRNAAGDALRPMFETLWLASGWRNGSPSFGRGAWDGAGSPLYAD